MKKSIFVCIVALVLAISGCQSSETPAENETTDKLNAIELERDAEELADEISLLTLGPDIEDELDRIQEAYDGFPAEIQKYVTNFDSYESIREQFDEEMDKVEEAIDAIDDLDDITENSKADINDAKSLLEQINPLFTELVTNSDEIATAEETFRQVVTDKGVEEVRYLTQAGKYQDAMDFATTYIAEHVGDLTSSAPLTEASQEAELYWAWDLYQNNYCGYVQDILDDLEYVCVTDELESYRKSLQDRMDNYLYSIMPANGTILASTISGGYGELTIYSGDSPMLVKIEGYGDSSRYIYVFLRANSSTTFNVPDGYYICKYATGDRYFGDTADKPFGTYTSFRQADDVLQFETTRSGNYIYYSVITLTLYYVSDGNMSTHAIDGL